MKRHYVHERGVACGRDGKAVTARVNQVTCLNCQKQPEFLAAKAEVDAQREAAFWAQTPRVFAEPWKDGLITCQNGHTLFRDAGRTCYGHYQDYLCSECGDRQSRLTETGMSF